MPADVVLGRAGDKSGKRNRLNAWHTPPYTAVHYLVLTHCVAPRGDVLMSMRSSTLQYSTHVVRDPASAEYRVLQFTSIHAKKENDENTATRTSQVLSK